MMGTFDIIILVLMIPALVRGITKGFVEQVIALAAILVSANLAYLFADKAGQWIGQYVNVNSSVLYIIGFAIIAIVTILLLNLLGRLVSKLLDTLSLGAINKILGVVFAVFNTALTIGLLMALFTDINSRFLHVSTQFMDDSVIYGWIRKVTEAVLPFIKDFFCNIKENAAI